MKKTYGQLADGTQDYPDFEKKVAEALKPFLLLKYKTKSNTSLCKRLYKKGYTVSDTVSFIILNSK